MTAKKDVENVELEEEKGTVKTIRLDKDLHKALESMVKSSNGRLRIGNLANDLIRMGMKEAKKAGGITIHF